MTINITPLSSILLFILAVLIIFWMMSIERMHAICTELVKLLKVLPITKIAEILSVSRHGFIRSKTHRRKRKSKSIMNGNDKVKSN